MLGYILRGDSMNKKAKASKHISSATVEKKEKLVRMTFEVPASLRKAFKLKTAEEEKSIKDVLRELMENYVKDNDKKN